MILQASDDWVVPSVLRQEDEEEGRERRWKRGQATAGVLSLLALIPLTSEDQALL